MSYRISVVIPAFNEAASIPELYREMTEALDRCAKVSSRELLFIDDGSLDGTAQAVETLRENDPSVVLIRFPENRGKADALMAGFKRASGDLVFTIDADLQDDPGEMPRFIDRLEEGYDLVSGWKQDRQDTAEKRLPSRLFNKVVSTTFRVPLHDFNCGFKLYRAEAAKALSVSGGMYRFLPVLAAQKGYRVTEIPVVHHKRKYGKSKYGWKRYFAGLRDYLVLLKSTDGGKRFYEIVRYGIAGGLTTLINVGGFALLFAAGLPYRAANVIALISCKVFAYAANKRFVFRSRCPDRASFLRELARYVLARGISGLADYLLLIGFVDGLHFREGISKLVIQVFVIVLNYILGKYLVFRTNGKES